MSACEVLTAEASGGVAPALRAVDCLAGDTVASAFARLFGSGTQGGGALLPALTIGLTLYIAFFAISLLTGRSRLGLSALTPRALTLGLVLTFATSWVAYSEVVWNLATGAPDEVASVLTGSRGSATQIFADRVDMVFAAIADAARNSQGQAAGEAAGEAAGGAAPQAAAQAQQGAQVAAASAGAAAQGSFTPANLMWLGALLLLLGTVGVLVTARIALAVLMAVGPVFVVFALFNGTRGLFVGWLRGMVMTSLVPLFVVVGGGVVLELLVPVVASLRDPALGPEAMGAGVDGRAALALFVIACVHVALMVMVMKVAGTMVAAWRVFGLADTGAERGHGDARFAAAMALPPMPPAAGMAAGMTAGMGATRRAALVPVEAGAGAPGNGGAPGLGRGHVTQLVQGAAAPPPLPRSRARGIGSRFAAPALRNTAGKAGGIPR
jgi:type IV secretion system protein VirB6